MFDEYSMVRSLQMVPYFGFTEEEVTSLCKQYDMDFEEAKEWYDGYHFIKGQGKKKVEYSIYSPKSVVDAMLNEYYDAYWSQTETYEALRQWIGLNFDGLKDAIIEMLSGGEVEVDPGTFQNDMSEYHSRDDVLTLLIHLGYLCYNGEKHTVSIPNKEVASEFVRSMNQSKEYSEVAILLKNSKKLLQALWNMDEEKVASGIEQAHQQFPSIHYNNENALSCVVELAFYYAREYYTIIRELPTGVGYADVCFLPKNNSMDKPAVIIELKWNQNAEGAIAQIKNKNYPERLKAYKGNMLLCGISYQKGAEKQHQCIMEQV